MEQIHSKILDEFGSSIIDNLQPKNTLLVSTPISEEPSVVNTNLFKNIPYSLVKYFFDLDFSEGQFDLIFGMLPLGLQGNTFRSIKFPTKQLSWELILKVSENLSDEGYGIFLMNPRGFNGYTGEHFLNRMSRSGIYVHAYINLPENVLMPATRTRPILVITRKQIPEISIQNQIIEAKNRMGRLQDQLEQYKKRNSKLRIFSLDQDTDIPTVTKELFLESPRLGYLDFLDHNEFNGFHKFEIKKQIQRLETRFKEFKSTKFRDVVKSTTMAKKGQSFEDLPNSVYFEIEGHNSNLITSPSQITGRIQNFLQVQLKDELSNEYLRIFFRSTMGDLIIQSITGIYFSEYLFETEIPVPEISIQIQIIETRNRMDRLQDQLDQFKNQISLNPISSNIVSKIDSMLEISRQLSSEDKIKSLVMEGESRSVEFKQTFQHCLKSKDREKYIETSALKSIAAFLNTNGGTLLIGVEDSGLILGVGFEIEKYHKNSNDKFLLHVKDKMKSRIGVTIFNFTEISLEQVGINLVLMITCLPSDREVFLDNKDFYVRTAPATEKLEGRDFSNYVRRRFIN